MLTGKKLINLDPNDDASVILQDYDVYDHNARFVFTTCLLDYFDIQ